MLYYITKNAKYSENWIDGCFSHQFHIRLFMSRECPRERIVNTLRGCDPSLVHRVPLLTSCYSSDMLSHKSAALTQESGDQLTPALCW